MQELPDLTSAVKFMAVADASKENLVAQWKSWVEQAGKMARWIEWFYGGGNMLVSVLRSWRGRQGGLQSLPAAHRPMQSCRSMLHSSNMSVHALDGY